MMATDFRAGFATIFLFPSAAPEQSAFFQVITALPAYKRVIGQNSRIDAVMANAM
jgi:hypothetical protein